MRKRWIKVVVIVALILLPVGIGWFGQDKIRRLYRKSQYPKTITIAAGSPGGRYHDISNALADGIYNKLGVHVEILDTEGSLENLLCLRAGKAQVALYQPGTVEILSRLRPDLVKAAAKAKGLQSATEGADEVAFVANMYWQPVNIIVRSGAKIEQPGDLGPRPDGRRRPVSVGLPLSGDYAMSLVLLEHFGLGEESIEKQYILYPAVEKVYCP